MCTFGGNLLAYILIYTLLIVLLLLHTTAPLLSNAENIDMLVPPQTRTLLLAEYIPLLALVRTPRYLFRDAQRQVLGPRSPSFCDAPRVGA